MRRAELEALERQASAGDRDSQYLAGCARHEDDNETLRDMNRALRWLRLASTQGDARADRRLGYIHCAELHDLSEGLAHYLKGAQRGDGASAMSAGALLADATYLREHHDPLRALPLFEQAFALEQPHADLRLGLLLLRAGFERRDPERGAQLVARASAHDFVRTLFELTDDLSAGRLVPLRYSTWTPEGTPPFPFAPPSVRLLPEADLEALNAGARSGDARAAHDLGVLCLSTPTRSGADRARARAAAFGHFRAAARENVPEGQFAFACLSLSDRTFANDQLAVRALACAAREGHVDAHRALQWLETNRRLSMSLRRS